MDKETARKQDEPKLANLLDTITPKARGKSFLQPGRHVQ